MRTLTAGRPKELIDVAGEPLLVHVLRECVASGILDVVIITAPGKDVLEQEIGPLAGTEAMPKRIVFVEQREPRGLADAIRLGRDFARGDALAVALPDNLFVDGPPALAQVLETHANTTKSVVAIVEISADEAARRGATAIYEGRLLASGEFELASIPDKGTHAGTFDTGGANAAFTGVGRFVFTPDAIDAIDEVERMLPAGRELDDVPVMQRLLGQERLAGRLISGRFLDVGLPEGYREANAVIAGRTQAQPQPRRSTSRITPMA